MKKRSLDDRAFEVQVRTAEGTFATEDPLIPDDMRDAMAMDPSYQSHGEGGTERSWKKNLLALSPTRALSPEEILLIRERAKNATDEN